MGENALWPAVANPDEMKVRCIHPLRMVAGFSERREREREIWFDYFIVARTDEDGNWSHLLLSHPHREML